MNHNREKRGVEKGKRAMAASALAPKTRGFYEMLQLLAGPSASLPVAQKQGWRALMKMDEESHKTAH